MTVWYKMGVEGDLTIPAQKCLGRIHDHYQKSGADLYVTAKRDGIHMAGSLHYNGNAFDFRKGSVGTWSIRTIAGKGFDVVAHRTHFHVEYDPKKGEI
jgi:hypothetical protein